VTRSVDGLVALFDADGARKYVCASEHRRFLKMAAQRDAEITTFCWLLAYTGCRISEGLSLTPSKLDAETGQVVFRTLKRRKLIFRAVPVPAKLMAALLVQGTGKGPHEPLWNWCRQTAWRRIKSVMHAAGIRGPQATAKGLRHGFGIANAEQNVPAALTQRWMGHALAETTAIYQHAVGPEERAFAKRLWGRAR
jgi:integrase/recombinase XerD